MSPPGVEIMKLSRKIAGDRKNRRGARASGGHRPLGRFSPRLERLEDRHLLTIGLLDESVEGLINNSGDVNELQLTIHEGGPKTVYQFVMRADGAGLDPGMMRVQSSSGHWMTPLLQKNDISSSNKDSLLLIQLPPGEYTLYAGGEKGTVGSYYIDALLPGDLNGDGVVDDFEDLWASAAVLQSSGGGNHVTAAYYKMMGIDVSEDLYRRELDANLNGVITTFDRNIVEQNNHGAPPAVVELVGDMEPPEIAVGLANDTGPFPGNRVTQDPTIAGQITDQSEIVAFDVRYAGGEWFDLWASGLVQDDGSFTLDEAFLLSRGAPSLNGELAEGTHTLQFIAEDELENRHDVPVTFTFTLDRTAPAAPSAPDLLAADDSGAFDDDNITNVTTPRFDVTAEANALVTLFANGSVIGEGTTNAAGFVRIASSPLAAGAHAITAMATDQAGNESALSAGLTVHVVTAAPITPAFQLDAVTRPEDDYYTAEQVVDIFGTTSDPVVGHPVAVTLSFAGQEFAVEATDGSFRFDDVALPWGVTQFTVTATDIAGNSSTFSRDVTRNAQPVIADQEFDVPDGAVEGTVIGTIVADDADIPDGDSLHYEIIADDSDGTFALDPATGVLTVLDTSKIDFDLYESFTLTVRVTDQLGLEADAEATVFLVDIRPPVIDVELADDTGFFDDDNYTSDPTIAGTITDQSAIEAFFASFEGTDGDFSAAAPTDWIDLLELAQFAGLVDGGSFTLDHGVLVQIPGAEVVNDSLLADGEYTLYLRARDEHGNVHDESVTLTFTLDTTPPAAPTDLTLVEDTGFEPNATNTNTPSFDVAADSGVWIELFVGDDPDPVAIAQVNNGTVTLTIPSALDEGAHDIRAFAVDRAGNRSVAAAELTILVDTVPPGTPEFTIDGVVGYLTGEETATFVGTTEAGARVGLFVDGVVQDTVTADATTGEFSFDVTLAFGDTTFTVVAEDGAGNVSEPFVRLVSRNNPPEFDEAAWDFAIAEDDETVGQVTAWDPDDEDDLTFSIIAGNDLGAFAIDGSGNITVANAAAFAEDGAFTLTVQVIDSYGDGEGGPGLTDTATVEITVNRYPVVVGETSFLIDDESQSGDPVGTLVAEDPDLHDLSYTIVSGDDDLFTIDENGNITLAVDDIEADSYEIVVRVSDNGNPPLSIDVPVAIQVAKLPKVIGEPAKIVIPDSQVGEEFSWDLSQYFDGEEGLQYSFDTAGLNTEVIDYRIDGQNLIVWAHESYANAQDRSPSTIVVRAVDPNDPALQSDPLDFVVEVQPEITAEIHLVILDTPTTPAIGDFGETPPDSITSVAAGAEFYVEVWVIDRLYGDVIHPDDPVSDGILLTDFNLHYNLEMLGRLPEPEDWQHGSGFIANMGPVSEGQEQVRLQSVTTSTGYGLEFYKRVGYLKLVAGDTPGTVSLSLDEDSLFFARYRNGDEELTHISQIDFPDLVEVTVTGTPLMGETPADPSSEGTGVHLSLVTEPTATGSGGQVDQLPESDAWIHEWNTHWVEVWVKSDAADGIGQALVDLNYNPQYFTATEVVLGPAFGGLTAASLDDAAGLVSGIGGVALDGGAGSDAYTLLGRVRFDSLADDGIAIDPVTQFIGPYHMGLNISAAELLTEGSAVADFHLGAAPRTELWAVPYDINNDGQVGVGDLLKLVELFGENSVDSDSPFARALDFDRSGEIDVSDLLSMVTNFGVTKADGHLLVFPESFSRRYIGTTLETEGDVNVGALLDAVVADWQAKLGIGYDVHIELVVQDFGSNQLGEAVITKVDDHGRPVAGIVTIDNDGMELGWYAHLEAPPTPGRFDLYSVLAHEVGHVLGFTSAYAGFSNLVSVVDGFKAFSTEGVFARLDAPGDHLDPAAFPDDLMNPTLPPGVRREITDLHVQILLAAYDAVPSSGDLFQMTPAAQMAETAEPFGAELPLAPAAGAPSWGIVLGGQAIEGEMPNLFVIDREDAPVGLGRLNDAVFGRLGHEGLQRALVDGTHARRIDLAAWLDGREEGENDRWELPEGIGGLRGAAAGEEAFDAVLAEWEEPLLGAELLGS